MDHDFEPLKVQAPASRDTSTNITNLHSITALTTLRLTTLIASTGTYCYTIQYHSTAVTIPTTRLKSKTTAFCQPSAQYSFWCHYESRQHKLCHGSGRLVAGLSPRRRGFDPRTVRVRFVVDNVTRWQVFLPALRLSAFSTIPPTLHNNSFTHLSLMLNTLQEHEGECCNINSGVFCEAGTPFFDRLNYVYKVFPLHHAPSPHQYLLPLTI